MMFLYLVHSRLNTALFISEGLESLLGHLECVWIIEVWSISSCSRDVTPPLHPSIPPPTIPKQDVQLFVCCRPPPNNLWTASAGRGLTHRICLRASLQIKWVSGALSKFFTVCLFFTFISTLAQGNQVTSWFSLLVSWYLDAFLRQLQALCPLLMLRVMWCRWLEITKLLLISLKCSGGESGTPSFTVSLWITCTLSAALWFAFGHQGSVLHCAIQNERASMCVCVCVYVCVCVCVWEALCAAGCF